MSSTLADLIEPSGDYLGVISWYFLSPQTAETMQVVFDLAFDHSWDHSKGFTLHHLTFINIHDVKAIKQLDFQHVLLALREIEHYTHGKKFYYEIDSEGPLAEGMDEDAYFISLFDEVIRNAITLEELIEAIINRLDAIEKITDKQMSILRQRARWLTSNPRTLESIGEEYGVTRERIRQIIKKYEEPLDQVTGTLAFAVKLSKLALQSNSSEELQTLAAKNYLTSSEALDLDQIEAIMQYLPKTEGWSGFVQQRGKWKKQEEDLVSLSRNVSKYRSKMGFIDLLYASQDLGLSVDQTISAIKARYPRSVVSGNLVLARTDKLVSTFESSVAKQLLVAPSASATELLVGARRFGSFRNDSMPGPDLDYENVIHAICGNPPNLETFLEGQLYPTELSDSDTWLINIFKSAPTGLLHRIEITKYAIESRMNLGSVTAYCSSNPVIRMHSSGIHSLIGVNPTSQQVAIHAELALSQDRDLRVDLQFSGSNVWVQMEPNLNAFASGVILPSRELRDVFSEFVFSPECVCGAIESKQVIRMSKDGFWTGFQSIFSHGLQQHAFVLGTSYKVFFDFDRNHATLHP